MNTVLVNISAYAFMTVIMAAIFKLSTKRGGLIVFLNFLSFAWAAFMTAYLIVNYENIISSPLNVRLNFYESITNYLLPFQLIISFLNEIYKKS